MASLVRSATTIGGYTLLSRIFGFVRDVLIAGYLGAGMHTDAFLVAFKLPNFMRRIFAEGAFNSAFIPLFAGTLAEHGKEKALEFARDIYAVLVMVLIIFCALAMIFMPWFMYVLAPGFVSDPAKFDLTVTLTRITFPYLLCISLVSLLGGLLNSFDKFAAVAATPVLMNLCMIGGMIALSPYMPNPAYALSIAVTISGVVQLLWLAHFCRKLGIMPKLRRPRMTPNVKAMLTLILPAALGAGIAQINLMVDTIMISHLPGGVSYLYYADRLNEFPLGVIGIAVGTALLPMLSKQIREGNHAAAMHNQNRAIEFTMLLSLPCAVALAVIAEPLIIVLFERGAFTPKDTLITYDVLFAYAFGLPAFILTKVFAPGFYANQDTKTPFKIACFALILNIGLNLLLIPIFGYSGPALATTLTGWINAMIMLILLRRKNMFQADAALLTRLPRIFICALLMGLALYTANLYLAPYFREALWIKTLALIALCGAGGLAYAGSVLGLHAVDLQKLKSYVKRG